MACFLLASASTFARNEVGSFSIQPKVGINIATMTSLDGTDPRDGFVGGAELEYQATPIFSVTAGALYSQQGIKFENFEIDGEDEVGGTIKMDYVNIPILANIYVSKGLALKVGVQPGFLINHKLKVKVDGVSTETNINGSSVKDVDMSIPFGISYCYKNIQLDARYYLGMSKVFSDDGSVKNSVFQITLGYKFKLGH